MNRRRRFKPVVEFFLLATMGLAWLAMWICAASYCWGGPLTTPVFVTSMILFVAGVFLMEKYGRR